MFSCPKCKADRSRILPVDPCPSCGAMLTESAVSLLSVEKGEKEGAHSIDSAKTELSAPRLDDVEPTEPLTNISEPDVEEISMDSLLPMVDDSDVVANSLAKDASEKDTKTAKPSIATAKVPSSLPKPAGVPAPASVPKATPSVEAKAKAKAKAEIKRTALGVHAIEIPPSKATQNSSESAPKIEEPKIDELATAILPPFEEKEEKGAASAIDSDLVVAQGLSETPFDDSIDLAGGVLTKTVADESVDLSILEAKFNPKASKAGSGPTHARADSPEVMTRTVADQAVSKSVDIKRTQNLPSPFTSKPTAAVKTPPLPGVASGASQSELEESRETISGSGVTPVVPEPVSKTPAPSEPLRAPRSLKATVPATRPNTKRVDTAPPSSVLPRPPDSLLPNGALPTPPASKGPSPFATPESWKSAGKVHNPDSMADMPAMYALPTASAPPVPLPTSPASAPPVATPLTPSATPFTVPVSVGPPPVIGAPPAMGTPSYPDAALSALSEENSSQNPNQVWREAHPSAQRWAQKRQDGAPRTPKPGIIAMGLMLAGIGSYLLFVFLPSKAPLTAVGKLALATQAGVDENAWRFSEKLMLPANLNAGLFIFLGVILVIRGALFRQPLAAKAKKKSKQTSIMLGFCFVLFALSFGALLLTASIR